MVRKRVFDGSFLFARLPIDRWSPPEEKLEADLRNLFLVYALEPVPPSTLQLAREIERRLEAVESAAAARGAGADGPDSTAKAAGSPAAVNASARKPHYH